MLGTEDDGFENDDKLLRHLVNILKRDVSRVFVHQCDMRAVTVEEKSVIWVHVKPSLFGPAWCSSGDEKVFYVREGASSPKYSDEDARKYIAGVFVDHDDEE